MICVRFVLVSSDANRSQSSEYDAYCLFCLRLSLYLSVCLPACLSTCLCLSIGLSACLSPYLYVSLPVSLSTCLVSQLVCPSSCMSLCLYPSLYVSLPVLYICLSRYPPVSLPVCLHICLSLSLSIYLALPVCLSLYLPVSLPACLYLSFSLCVCVASLVCLPMCLCRTAKRLCPNLQNISIRIRSVSLTNIFSLSIRLPPLPFYLSVSMIFISMLHWLHLAFEIELAIPIQEIVYEHVHTILSMSKCQCFPDFSSRAVTL